MRTASADNESNYLFIDKYEAMMGDNNNINDKNIAIIYYYGDNAIVIGYACVIIHSKVITDTYKNRHWIL